MNIIKIIGYFLCFGAGLCANFIFKSEKADDLSEPNVPAVSKSSAREPDTTTSFQSGSFIRKLDGGYLSFDAFKRKIANSEGVNEHSPTFVMDALVSYGAALVRLLGVDAIAAIQNEPLLSDCGPAAPAILEAMYELHGKENSISLIESYKDIKIQNMLKEILAKLIMVENPDDSYAYATINTPQLLLDQDFIGYLAIRLCKGKSVEEMIQYVTSLALPKTSELAAKAIGDMMATNDPATTEKTLSSIVSMTDSNAKTSLMISYLAEAVSYDPAILLHPSIRNIKLNDELYYKAGNVMSGKSWDKVLLYSEGVQNLEQRSRFMLGYIDSLTEMGYIDQALNRSIEVYNSGTDDGQLMTRSLGNMVRITPEKAVDYLLSDNLPGEIKSSLAQNLMNDIASADYSQARRIIDSGEFSGSSQEKLLTDIARYAAEEDPVKALNDIYAKISNPVYSSIALGDITSQFYKDDSEKCINWINRLPSGELRDGMINRVSNTMVANDVQGALNYAALISDKSLQIATISTLYHNHKNIQPSMVENWANNNPEIMKSIAEYEKKFIPDNL